MTKRPTPAMTDGQKAYEARRAAKAGVSLDKWLGQKDRERAAEERDRIKQSAPPPPVKPPGLLSRLLSRAQKPI